MPFCVVTKPGCILAACRPLWSRGFAYRVWRGAKVWDTSALPSYYCHPTGLWLWNSFCGPGSVFPGDAKAVSPWQEEMLRLVEVSQARGGGRAMAKGSTSSTTHVALGPRALSDAICGDKGCAVHGQAQGRSDEWGAVGAEVPLARPQHQWQLTCGWGGRRCGGRGRRVRRSSPATSWDQGSPGPR